MSNLLTEPSVEVERALFADLLVEPARTLRVARLLGASAIVELGDNLTLVDILDGAVKISEESTVYDRNGIRVDTDALLAQVEVQ